MYLSGCVRADLPAGVGLMLTRAMSNRLPAGRLFACDTGCFNDPGAHDVDAYLRWVQTMDLARCLFATAADRFNDGAETLRVALPELARIRALGVRAAFVLQPGTPDIPWDAFDCLFLGGRDAWQQSDAAHDAVREARARGKWTHRGRVNSMRRIMGSKALGFDSCDGTMVAFEPNTKLRRLERVVGHAQMQGVLI